MENNSQSVNNGELYRILNRFNWGAFLFFWLWGLGNGCFKKVFVPWCVLLLVSILCRDYLLIISLCAILLLLWAFMCGKRGNEWAYEGRAWRNLQEFEDTQRNWGSASAVVAAIALLIVVILIVIYFFFFNK